MPASTGREPTAACCRRGGACRVALGTARRDDPPTASPSPVSRGAPAIPEIRLPEGPSMSHSVRIALLACALASGAARADEAPAPPRYTFSWPLDAANLKPRGGTTRGAPITLDTAESAAWKSLQATDLTAPERDRRAILAMAGTYRVTFDFLEVAPFAAAAKPLAPYQSWGAEKVYVDRDEPGFVSLVHILEMRIVQPDGKVSEPMVTKHWRQDWTFEPAAIVEYQGRDRWQRRKLTAAEVAGAWSQVVYQVDES